MTPTYFYIVTRNPPKDGSDAGAIEEGWFIVADGVVRLTNRDGMMLHGEENMGRPKPGQTAREVAARLLKAKTRRRPYKPFNRPLRYQRIAY
jgi:hypothetical protein